MSDVCDFSIAARIVNAAGATVLDLNDHTAGLYLLRPILPPSVNVREVRTSATRVDGSFRLAEAYDDGFLPLRVSVRAATWAGVETLWQTVQDALYAEPSFFIELAVEGVTRRWRTERPDTDFGDVDPMALRNTRMTLQINFRVQPNPTISYA